MATPVIMPKQGQSVETCIISRWFKSAGDKVSSGDLLFSYETDKAAFDLEAEDEGILLEVFYNDGDVCSQAQERLHPGIDLNKTLDKLLIIRYVPQVSRIR